MTLIPYILIAIPTCLLAIAVWTYFDYRKYKKKNSLILLLFLFYPMLLHAQYTDRNHCSIAFTSHKNQPGTLEQVKDNMIFQFIPNNVYLANLHTSFLCNLIYPTFITLSVYIN